MVRPVMLYKRQCWAIKNQHEHKLSVAEMIMLHEICGKTRRDRIKNDNMRERGRERERDRESERERVGIALVLQKIIETRLRWFRHGERRLRWKGVRLLILTMFWRYIS